MFSIESINFKMVTVCEERELGLTPCAEFCFLSFVYFFRNTGKLRLQVRPKIIHTVCARLTVHHCLCVNLEYESPVILRSLLAGRTKQVLANTFVWIPVRHPGRPKVS